MSENDEKPLLTCHPFSDNLPMVLSGEGTQPTVQVPSSITRFLRNYQRDGVRFLYERFKAEEGGILADDMGLGKTVQAIAFMAAVLHMKGTKEDKLRHCSAYIRNDVAPGLEVTLVDPVLIVCPASITDNWMYELHVWGYFRVLKLTTGNRMELINQARRRECDIVIVTFETARSFIHDLNSVKWTCILVDEVHRIKDTSSQISKALNSLPCKRRYGLTGTPFQNNMKEIWCLLKWSNPEAINNLQKESNDISRLMEQGLRCSATKRDSAEKSLAQLRFTQVRGRLILRRTKKILAAHLPTKTDQIVFCELTEVQKNIYHTITQSSDVQTVLGEGICKYSRYRKKQTGIIFTYLHLLQKTANHVGLLASGLSSGTNEVSRKVCKTALQQLACLKGVPQKKWFDSLADISMSGKMVVLFSLLPSLLEKGDKILLFSYSTKLLNLVQQHVKEMRYKFWRLDGSTPADSRLSLVTSFNMYPHAAIFLLSTKAGGVGLNMTGANVVIIFDPCWNPAHDLQAQDRAYRLGQQKDVRVLRLLSTSTIEEMVYLRQVYKQQLGTLSMTDKNARRYFDGELFGIKNLFSFRESHRSLTEEILEKQKKLELKVQLKLEAPQKEECSKINFSSCAMREYISVENAKSGLTQLCEDVFQVSCDYSEDSSQDDENKECSQQEDDNASICTLLEKTGVVRHVINHQDLVTPSKVEDFVADCAIKDVFEKGINSQMPAFDCSIGSQDVILNKPLVETETMRKAVICRLKFNQLAKSESLSTYQLAAKVVAMSVSDRENLLRKHQKQELALQHTSCCKRGREECSSSNEAADEEKESPTKVSKLSAATYVNADHLKIVGSQKPLIVDQFENQSRFEVRDKVQSLHFEENKKSIHTSGSINQEFSTSAIDKSANVAEGSSRVMHSSSQSSDKSELSSSFERETKSECPELSKETILLLKTMFCSKKKKKAVCSRRRKSSDGYEMKEVSCQSSCDSPPKTYQEKIKDQDVYLLENVVDQCVPSDLSDSVSSHLSVDETSGCSKTVKDFIDSLFSSNKRLPSPKKSSQLHSSNVGATAVDLSRSDHSHKVTKLYGHSSTCTNINLDPNFSSIFNSTTQISKPCLEFKAEDDVFKQMINSGKLKLN